MPQLRWVHRPISASRRSHGQSLVEFALVLPVLLLLLMVAIDFGRVYLGWVNLQNMARIAANYAANNATEFQANDPVTLAVYQKQVLNDAAANNCKLPPDSSGKENVPPPLFSGYDVGDSATVSLTCRFGIITPIISNILGATLNVSASSQFPVKTGIVAATNTGGGGGSGTPVTASFSCAPTSGAVTLAVQCNDESGGGPTSWSWTVSGPGGSTQTSGVRDPLFALTDPGSYNVTLIADNALNQPSTQLRVNYIVAAVASIVDFIADNNSGTAPLTVNFTDKSSGSPTAWAWDFDSNGSVDSTLQNPPHVFSTAGSYDVTLKVTNAAGTFSKKATGFIVVAAPNCIVPSFTGVKRNNASALWSSKGFTATNLSDGPGAPHGNYTINFQSITPGTPVPCTSLIQVNG